MVNIYLGRVFGKAFFVMMVASLMVVGVLAYLVGSISIHRYFGLPDYDAPEVQNSCLRASSRFFLNVSKGIIVVHFAGYIGATAALIAAFFVALGHNYPIWRGFRGGIGLGVLLGGMIALHPTLGLFALSAWLLAYYVFQKPVVAGLTTAMTTPLLAGFLTLPFQGAALLPMTALVLWRHRKVWGQAFDFGPKATEDAFRNL